MSISSWPIHVFLFALFPLLLLFADNVEEIPLEDLLLPSLVSLLIIGILWIVTKIFVGGKKSALILSIFIILLISISQIRLIVIDLEYEVFQIFGSNKFLIPLFFIITIPVVIYIIKRNISNDSTSIINAISIVIFAFLIFQVVSSDSVNMDKYISITENIQIPIIQSNVVEKPDVYVLVLDAYSGDITLEQDYNYDNSEFKNELKNRGFVVQKPSYSNYPNTEFSMPSIMNMVYLDFLVSELGPDSQNKKPAIELRLRNTVMDIFNQNGYHLTSFYGGLEMSPSDDSEYEILCGRGILNMNEDLQYSFIQTYFTINYLRIVLYDDFRYHDLECAINEVLQFEKKNEKPQYVHAHLYLPHPPFVYNSSGERVNHKYADNRFDESLRDAYLEQLIFANKITLEMIDSIQNRDANSVIILMSDHGGRLGVDWNNPTELDYYRAFNNLSAFYFPGHADELPENIAAVNTFRVFFNAYFDTDYELLEDRQMWYVPGSPYDQTNVTEQIMK